LISEFLWDNLLLFPKKSMETKTTQQKKNLVEQACDNVIGFTAFYQQLKQKLSLAGRSEKTLRDYGSHLSKIALHFNRLPSDLSISEIENYLYQIQLRDKHPSESYFKHAVYCLRFIFTMVGRDEMRIKLPEIKYRRKLPIVLSKEEMVRMINRPTLFKHRILIALLYGCGLRCFEARNLRLSDLDLDRCMLYVREGKGKKDRYVPLGKILVTELKQYIKLYKPSDMLFQPGKARNVRVSSSKIYSSGSVRFAINSAAKKAGILKSINIHTMRHTFATHLLEDGMDIVSIKELLGHSRLESTLIYLHVAQTVRKIKASPIDNLQGLKLIRGIQCKMDFETDEELKFV